MTNYLISLALLIRNYFGLIFYPYKTMRKIALERDYRQLILIFTIVYGYFILANIIRRETLHPFIISSSSFISFIFFLLTFFFTLGFFYILFSRLKKIDTPVNPLIYTFAYSLLPTLIWFFVTSLIYMVLPPPRTVSLLGQSFSVLFIIFSLTLLVWRIVLLYLSLKFSLKMNFYSIAIMMIAFTFWFLPYSYVLYRFGIFRIPFI